MRKPDLPLSRYDDWCAALLSVVPGLGHLYKGHVMPGVFLLCLAGPALLTVVFLLVAPTLGLSLILPAIFVGLTAMHAFQVSDVRKDPGVTEQARRTLANWFGKRRSEHNVRRSARGL